MPEIWTCPKCQREFFRQNQTHYCSDRTIEDIFEGKAADVVLAFDALLLAVAEWEPQVIGAGKNAIIFNNGKAWMVVRALKTELDVSFFYNEILKSSAIKTARLDNMGKNKYVHTLRLRDESDVTPEVVDLLRKGFDFILNSKRLPKLKKVVTKKKVRKKK
ncbi:DUF5655 domain-containing protein [Lewinella sp. 4G2]|uniref:DUF5655 domain-containing protein n=1 Tax=Lewinella sp. 4G2 TaxID=1803372 RepID=UPI0007B483C2|nr:DUF5655 domain-containing protein [Lewinella sp. 4G2]OAV46280.1 hypothetical protein A3850_018665 [Lewinella sp. 4G2]